MGTQQEILRATAPSGALFVTASWLWLKQVTVNKQHSSFPVIFKMSSCIHFPHVLLHLSLHQLITNNVQYNNSKNTRIITHLRRWPFNHATINDSNSYLNYFFILSRHGWLSYMHTSKLQHNYISHSENVIGPSSAISWVTKSITGPTSWFPKSWSQTQWPRSFQQHILPGFLFTIYQSSAQQDPTISNWGSSKNSTTK